MAKVSHRGAGCPRYSDRAAKSQPKPQREPTPDVSVSESDYSSDDTVEDEDGDELTPAMDAAILRTLSKIRGRTRACTVPRTFSRPSSQLRRRRQRSAACRKTAQRKAEQGGWKPPAELTSQPFLLKDFHRDNLLAGVQPTAMTRRATSR
jgi:protein KRI1